jgi:hypothetical protein
MPLRTRFLVLHDYGQGGLWAFVEAASAAEIEEKYREVRVITTTPAWLTAEHQQKLDVHDVDQPTGWLAMLRK